jgi:hypothetical protein
MYKLKNKQKKNPTNKKHNRVHASNQKYSLPSPAQPSPAQPSPAYHWHLDGEALEDAPHLLRLPLLATIREMRVVGQVLALAWLLRRAIRIVE